MQQTFSHNCDVVIVTYNAGKLVIESVQSLLARGNAIKELGKNNLNNCI